MLKSKHGFVIDGGYGKLKGKTFRISNMGDETDETIAVLLQGPRQRPGGDTEAAGGLIRRQIGGRDRLAAQPAPLARAGAYAGVRAPARGSMKSIL